MEPVSGSMAVAVVVKSSILTATVTSLFERLAELLREDSRKVQEGEGEEEEELLVVESEDKLLRAFRVGAGCLVACPVAYAAGAGLMLRVPWQTAVTSFLISEAAFAPFVAVAWLSEGGEDCTLYRYAPHIVLAGTWGTFAATYTISVFIMHHRIALWPIISSTGDLPPESIVWTLGGLLTGVGLMSVCKGWELGYKGQPPELRNEVRQLTPLGVVSGVSMIGVAVFRSGATVYNYVHMPCAVVSWSTLWLAMAYHTHLAWQVEPRPGAPRNTSVTQADVLSLRNRRFICLAWSGVSAVAFMLQARAPILAAVAEYSACISWSACLATFAPEFENKMIGAPPGAYGYAPGDAGGVGGAFAGREEIPSLPASPRLQRASPRRYGAASASGSPHRLRLQRRASASSAPPASASAYGAEAAISRA